MGVSLVRDMPMSDERRALILKEEERERRAAELEEAQRREAAYERRWVLERQGVVPHSVGDVLQSAAVAQDRQDRRDRAAEERAAELLGRPKPTVPKLLRDAKAERLAREAAEEAEPVSKAELGRTVKKLANSIWNATGHKVL
jgi:hypothetical protein